MIRALILFTFLSLFSFAQKNNGKSTDKYKIFVDQMVAENVTTQKSPDKVLDPGGSVTGYYLKNKLVLITTRQKDAFAYIAYSFYIQKDTLVFVTEKKVNLKEPVNEKEYADYEKYLIFNTDKSGNTDFTKWPLTLDFDNTYYLQSNRITSYQLKNLNKPVKAMENEIEETNRELIRRYTAHLEQLN